MKTIFRSSRFFLALAALFSTFQSCKPKDDAPEPVRIQNVVSQEIINELKSRGMQINEGNRPPKLDLSVRVSPMKLLVPYGEDDNYEKGKVIPDNFYKFYGQTDSQEITYDFYQENQGTDGAGEGAFIIGSDNRFTIFSEEKGISSRDIPFKTVAITSGVLDGKTIKDFQHAFVLTDKTGDEKNEYLMPVGKSRIWIDGDGISEPFSGSRTSAAIETRSGSPASVQ